MSTLDHNALDPVEPSEPRPRQRHLGTWLFGAMLGLIFASTAALFQWGEMKYAPGFVKIWKLRGDVLATQYKYGRDSGQTLDARFALGWKLFADGSYKAAGKQFRVVFASGGASWPTNYPIMEDDYFIMGECLFMEGKEAEAK